VIDFADVTYRYPDGTNALTGASVSFQSGEITAIVGPNGSGKSTMARLMMGLLLPTDGRILVDEQDTRTTPASVIRRLVGLAWQNPDNQLVCGVVEDDIAFGPENLGLTTTEIAERIDEAEDLLQLGDIRTTSIHSLSSAQKQLVAVAGAMALRPSYLILDEVTARLDPSSSHRLLDGIRVWARDHRSGVIMITHHLSEVLRADRVCRLEALPSGGRVAAFGSPDEILRDAKHDDDVALESPLYDTIFRLEQNGVHLAGVPETVDELVEQLCR